MNYLELLKFISGGTDWDFSFDSKESIYYAKVVGDITYVYCTGTTNTFRDWARNFMFWKKPYKNMDKVFYTHAGFMKDYHLVRDELLKWMKENHPEENKVVVTGYSQGAAIAQIAYEDLQYHGYEVLECVAYAAPRVFAAISSKEMSTRLPHVTRFENSQDVVTRIPYVVLGYKHIGEKHHVGEKRQWWRLLGKFGKDHMRPQYLKSIEEWMKEDK